MREDDIRTGIKRLDGDPLERFARELLRRELYPGLNPTSASHDLGEDAHTEQSTLFQHGGQWISLAVSKTCTLRKIKDDCIRCKDTHRKIDVLVFATSGNPNRETVEGWQKEIKQEFGWDFEVRAIGWLAPAASKPEYESLVDDYLQVAPPDGDFTTTIVDAISKVTQRTLLQIHSQLPGVANSLPRSEVAAIEGQLLQARSVVLTGDAGTGKSGIGATLAANGGEHGKVVLLLDARDVAHISSEVGLRQQLGLKGPVASAIVRIGRQHSCRLIIDQLDNVVGSTAASVLSDVAIECTGRLGVEVVIITRKRESHEEHLIEPLFASGFVELTSYYLNENEVEEVLRQMGILNPSHQLIELGRNFLNLELVGRIKQQKPAFDFANVSTVVDLWDQYRQVLIDRENMASAPQRGENMVAEAVKLARIGLTGDDGLFKLAFPFSDLHQRLISWEVIVRVDGRDYRFRHEKLQDFIYAWDASERNLMPGSVLEEIGAYKSRNVLAWMDELYARRASAHRMQFLREMLNVE